MTVLSRVYHLTTLCKDVSRIQMMVISFFSLVDLSSNVLEQEALYLIKVIYFVRFGV